MHKNQINANTQRHNTKTQEKHNIQAKIHNTQTEKYTMQHANLEIHSTQIKIYTVHDYRETEMHSTIQINRILRCKCPIERQIFFNAFANINPKTQILSMLDSPQAVLMKSIQNHFLMCLYYLSNAVLEFLDG